METSPLSELRRLKKIEKALKPSSFCSFDSIFRYVLHLAAFLDLSTFLFIRHLSELKALEIEEESNRYHRNVLGVIRRQWEKIPFHRSNQCDLQQDEGHFIEKYQWVFASFFCVCWLIEGIRIGLAKSNSSANRSKLRSRKQSTSPSFLTSPFVIFAAITMFYIMLLPLNFFMSKSSIKIHNIGGGESTAFDYSAYDSFSLPYTLVVYYYGVTARLLKAKVRVVAARMASFAFWNPMKFKKNLSHAITVLKSVKRGFPIFKAFEKIFKKMKKVIKLKKQRYQAAKQRKFQRMLWKKISPEEQALKAALRIQSDFRRRQAMKKVQPLLREKRRCKTEKEFKIKQESLRSLHESSKELDEKTEQLIVLKKSVEINDNPKEMEDLQLLEMELESSLNSKKRIMAIIRPNSRFCLSWHFFVFLCIVIENAWKYLPAVTTLLTDVGMLLPTKISEYFVTHGLLTLNVIYLIDVLVDFFTGKFDADGQLVPEPIIVRWLPFVLKSLGNPLTSACTKAVMNFSLFDAGPGRVLRWLIAFVFPYANVLLKILIWSWFRFVQNLNDISNNHTNHTTDKEAWMS